MGGGLGFVCVGALIGLTIGVLIGALILRAAVWCTNKCLPQPQPHYRDDDYDDRDDDDDFDRPVRRRPRRATTAIPEPDFGRACLIVFVNFIIQLGIGFVLGFMAGAAGVGLDGIQVIQILSYVIGFFISAAVCTAMLPTSFGRACLVVLFQYLIAIVIVIIVAVPLVLALGIQLRGL